MKVLTNELPTCPFFFLPPVVDAHSHCQSEVTDNCSATLSYCLLSWTTPDTSSSHSLSSLEANAKMEFGAQSVY
jgi:hypothetical protein